MMNRRLTEEDAAAYWALRLEALESEPRSFGVTPEEHRQTTVEGTAALIATPGTFLMGAFDGQTLVGTARFVREPGIKGCHKGHVYGVYVSASYRGRGLAKSLLGALIDQVRKDATCEQLLLAVGVFNEPARRAYLALGFVPFGVEPRALRSGGDYIDEEHMVLFLR